MGDKKGRGDRGIHIISVTNPFKMFINYKIAGKNLLVLNPYIHGLMSIRASRFEPMLMLFWKFEAIIYRNGRLNVDHSPKPKLYYHHPKADFKQNHHKTHCSCHVTQLESRRTQLADLPCTTVPCPWGDHQS